MLLCISASPTDLSIRKISQSDIVNVIHLGKFYVCFPNAVLRPPVANWNVFTFVRAFRSWLPNSILDFMEQGISCMGLTWAKPFAHLARTWEATKQPYRFRKTPVHSSCPLFTGEPIDGLLTWVAFNFKMCLLVRNKFLLFSKKNTKNKTNKQKECPPTW